mgnify:CR=1 FL=1
MKTARNSTKRKHTKEAASIPTGEFVKILEIETAGLAKQVDEVKNVAANMYVPTNAGSLSGENQLP